MSSAVYGERHISWLYPHWKINELADLATRLVSNWWRIRCLNLRKTTHEMSYSQNLQFATWIYCEACFFNNICNVVMSNRRKWGCVFKRWLLLQQNSEIFRQRTDFLFTSINWLLAARISISFSGDQNERIATNWSRNCAYCWADNTERALHRHSSSLHFGSVNNW